MSKADSTRANNNPVNMCHYWISMVQVATPSFFLFDKKYGMILPIRFVIQHVATHPFEQVFLFKN